MAIRLAKRMDILKTSEIREILKVTVRPEVISFAGGLPAPELFPVDDIRRAADAVLQRAGREVLQYSTTEGHAPPRAAVAARLKRDYALDLTPDEILITSGSQQGLDLTAKLFLIERLRVLYRTRRDAMVAAIAREFPPGIRHTRPQGGLFLSVELPPHVNARDVLERCLAKNVAFVPGGSFFPNGGHENTVRLNYSNMSEERIEEGIRRLGTVLRELC